MKVVLNPEYEEVSHHPFVGIINGFECYDTTKPRLTDAQYEAQCEYVREVIENLVFAPPIE